MPTAIQEAYGLARTTSLPYTEAVPAIKEALKGVGFGVLWEIDIPATLKAKIGVEGFRDYVILGACNPHLAHRALTAELDLGLLLPCNVVVYDAGEGRTAVKAIEPDKMMGFVGNPALEPVAAEAREKLLAALEALPA
ncbi:MAG: DUF302 domain-containing protein [Candidatus Sericytochromatia bacterium]|nr:DUF302 domain-containing protein [Candidatus Sericytochromatia bacterium]